MVRSRNKEGRQRHIADNGFAGQRLQSPLLVGSDPFVIEAVGVTVPYTSGLSG